MIVSPSYPTPLSGYMDCASTFYLSQSCNLIQIEFVEFFTASLNFLYINNVSYSLSMSTFSTMLNVSTSHLLDLRIVFSYPSRTAGQRFLLQYSCGKITPNNFSWLCYEVDEYSKDYDVLVSEGTLVSMVDPMLNPVPQALQPIYITSGLQNMRLVNGDANQVLRYEVSVQTQRNRQSMFYLKNWRAEDIVTESCDTEPVCY